MTGVAAGMALSGKIVFTYSIANFPTLRCLEQIRNDVCYHQREREDRVGGRRLRLRVHGRHTSRHRGSGRDARAYRT